MNASRVAARTSFGDAVPRWLNQPSIRPRILAFRPAPPRGGGAGGLYVLLRRKHTHLR